MGWDWNEMFGSGFYYELKDSERKYFGLDEIGENTDTSVFYSKTNIWYKRTTVFWDDDIIVKVIAEEIRLPKDEVTLRSYNEYDTCLKTDNRQMILPLTNRGKPKKLTAANILAVTAFGCSFCFSFDNARERPDAYIHVINPRNNQTLAVGEDETISKIRTSKDFRDFIEYYVSTCPEGYFEKVEHLKNAAHVTVKYHVGDIFRIELDRFNYCYGIITGEVLKMQKWSELPEHHSLHSAMMVPLMIRYFDIKTPRRDMTTEELADIPLGTVEICGDNDIIWGTHPIIGHRELSAEDIAFNLICTKFTFRNENFTVFTQDFLMNQGFVRKPDEYSLHVEWGTAMTFVLFSQLSEKLREYMEDYYSPFGGVHIGIYPSLMVLSEERKAEYPTYKYDLLEEINREMKNELFSSLGLPKDASFDDFARKFGGMTREEILKKL